MINNATSIPFSELENFLELLKTDLIQSLQAAGSDASGQTAKKIILIVNGDTLQLELPGYMLLLETGRRPASFNAISGNPPMIQRIREWCREKNIPDKAAWAIKRSIDKKGFKGKPGVLTIPLGDDNINQKLDKVLFKISEELIGLIGVF